MGEPTAQASMRLLGVALLAMVVAAVTTVGVALLIDRSDRPEIRITPLDPGPIAVHVAGAVATPGVYTLPREARLVDLVDAAGGMNAEADIGSLNLAARLGDGETVRIPSRVDAQLATSAAEPGVTESGLVDINTADLATLQTLPGIGPVIGQRIIDNRAENGPFESVDAFTRRRHLRHNGRGVALAGHDR